MMSVENKPFEISVIKEAEGLVNARNLVAEISELIYFSKHEE